MKVRNNITLRKGFDGSGVIFNATDNSLFSLNDVCVLIFEQIQQGKSKQEILAILSQKVLNLPQNLSEQLDGFIEQLRKRNIIDNEE